MNAELDHGKYDNCKEKYDQVYFLQSVELRKGTA